MGQAFSGTILLATATSLPELATTITAVVALNNPTLAIHNLLGGVALQTALIALADISKPTRGALTFFSPRFGLLLEAIGLLLVLQIAMAGITAGGDPAAFSVSAWSFAIFATHLGVGYFVYRYRGDARWTPTHADDTPREVRAQLGEAEPEDQPGGDSQRSTGSLWMIFAALSAAVLVGGWVATQTADVMAEQTGLGSAFIGATLLALATSLPEVTTTISAARKQRYTTAISNVFGSNSFDVSLILLADLLFREGSIMRRANDSVLLVAGIGAIMTLVYLWGLIERENRSIRGILGWDSAAALTVYAGGMIVLYRMTSS
jgi:cation:H+ antiporter